MNFLFRAILTSLAVIVIFYMVYWFSLIPLSFIPLNGQQWIAPVVSLFCAVGAGWYVWSRTRSVPGTHDNQAPAAKPPSTWIKCVLRGSIGLGALGFSAGFFGPMVLTPGANQGPLLGIFITGPAGFLLGAVGGFLYWLGISKGDESSHRRGHEKSS